jgi:hypothetical protein
MRTSPVARLGVIQVARGKRDTVVVMTGRGPTSHATLFRTPPPPVKGRMARGVRNPLEAVDHDE